VKRGNGRLPFFCIHGAGGNVLNFRDLARRLGPDQPFYGLQAQGVDGKQAPLDRVEDMADLYLAEIRRVQPHGPYLLGGYSGGGVVAYEIAQRLRQEGERVGLLAFLDTFCPILPPAATQYTMRDRLKRLAAEGPGYVVRWPRQFFDRQKTRADLLRARWYARRGRPVPLHLRELYMTDSYLRAQANYRPEAFPGEVTLFRASDVPPIYQHIGRELGWGPFVKGMLDIVEVPGSHDSLVQEPNVSILVAHLGDRLKEAQAAA
jgi:thioesterase domain-containing protein